MIQVTPSMIKKRPKGRSRSPKETKGNQKVSKKDKTGEKKSKFSLCKFSKMYDHRKVSSSTSNSTKFCTGYRYVYLVINPIFQLLLSITFFLHFLIFWN